MSQLFTRLVKHYYHRLIESSRLRSPSPVITQHHPHVHCGTMTSSAVSTHFLNASRDGNFITCLGSLLKLFKTLIVIFFPNISSKPHLVHLEVIILLCLECEYYLSFGYFVINKCWSFCLCNCIESSWTREGAKSSYYIFLQPNIIQRVCAILR